MKKQHLAFLLIISFSILSSCSKDDDNNFPDFQPGIIPFTIKIEGTNREYAVYLPESYTKEVPVPLVIVLHGGGGTGFSARVETKMDQKAEMEGFIAVFPEGTRPNPNEPAQFGVNSQIWNDGSGRFSSVVQDVPDVLFISKMIDAIQGNFNVDGTKILVTGFSNGSSMTFRLGLELQDRIHTIVPIAGSSWMDELVMDSKINLLYITGTEDSFNPIEGGMPKTAGGTVIDDKPKPPVNVYMDQWANAQSCGPVSTAVVISEGLELTEYPGCGQGVKVQYLFIEGQGHVWPGAESLLPAFIVGEDVGLLNATDYLWDFFVSNW